MGAKRNMEEKKERQPKMDTTNPNCRLSGSHGEALGQHLTASASSPSLLTGCGDRTTSAGENIERHIKSHNIPTEVLLTSPPVSPVASTNLEEPNFHIPDSVFLTPNPPRLRGMTAERPSSAPANTLEIISGTLLRLVGDHYMCSTCGRQLRTIGDQLTAETNLRRVFSSSDLPQQLQNG